MADIYGSSGNDTLFGTNADDRIYGLAGDDVINGGGGFDLLVGGAGNDRYYIDDARASIVEIAGEGTDTLTASVNYILSAGQYIEIMYAIGAISLTGNELVQTINGDNAANILEGGGGADILVGGAGDDIYIVRDSQVRVKESFSSQGYDTVYTTVDYELNFIDPDYIEMLSAYDVTSTDPIRLIGNERNQTIIGNAGDNYLFGRGGTDVLIGKGGDDFYYVSGGMFNNRGSYRIIEAENEGYDTVSVTFGFTIEPGQSIERLVAHLPNGTSGLQLTGNELAQTIVGNDGANILRGGGGADVLVGRGGDDTYIITDAAASLIEAANEGNDAVATTISFDIGSQSIEILYTQDATSTNAMTLKGNAAQQWIAGNAGDNILDSGGGTDILVGREGNDIYIVSGGEAVQESANQGTDTVRAKASYTLTAGQSIEIFLSDDPTATTAMTLKGNALEQWIAGNAGDNILDSGGGTDILVGRGGNDTYIVTGGEAVLESANEGTDTVRAKAGYTLYAGQSIEIFLSDDALATAATTLKGNELLQWIAGNAGDNIIDGGGGADILVGRGGNDSFAFTSALGTGAAYIDDFTKGSDRILLDDAVFTGLSMGTLSSAAFTTGTAATTADQRIIYNASTGAILFDADGSGAGAAIQFATVAPFTPLAASDFTVI